MEIIHLRTNRKITNNTKYARTGFERLKGLMFTRKLVGMDSLLLEPCNSIHNCFVFFALDVVFIDKNNKVVKVLRDFKPWRFSWIYLSARKVLELPAGNLIDDIVKGDQLEVRGV